MQINLDKNLKRILWMNVFLTIILVLFSAYLVSYRLHKLNVTMEKGFEKISNQLVAIDMMVGKVYLAEVQKDKYLHPDLLPNRAPDKKKKK